MKIIKIDQKQNYFEIIPQNIDDLWHLTKVLEKGDIVSGGTERKIKPRYEGDSAIKIRMFIELEVEKAELHETSHALRISGIILGGSPAEFIELKAHHTIDLFPNEKISVKKKELKKWQIEILEKAKKATESGKLLAVILDDETADFFIVKEFGFEFKFGINSGKSGKMFETSESGKYFSEIVKKAQEIAVDKIIFAGPGFTKNDLKKYLEERGIKLQAHFETINSVGITGMNELMKSGIIEKVYREFEIVKDAKLVEKIFAEIGKNSGLVAYGFTEVENAVNAGAIEKLVICESILMENREKAEALMEKVEQYGGNVHIISDENDAGKRLKSLTGIAALLRYKFNKI